ncbi:putative capsule polysaccharide export inner-membrane protein [Sphingomonas sp. MM-1]|uniref:putative capsule polysaccharide export inner-membrane protein n=1 Tax=Sphingomonas sp. MM-1 TaxID=745310 RepID=UPI0002C0E3B5|nr:putative capsule polysaccharide export inner-membrane protein [Sphingomonas sp. MM-1]AGH49933.1 putative capsule polysaccharide export inner-membrane protein [Sphingomonas sp. MM-1]
MLMESRAELEIQLERRASRIAAKARRHRWFLLFVVLPTLLAAIYYGAIASDVYVSESRFAIKSPGRQPSQTSALASLFQSTGLSAGQEQANEVIAYLRSRDALTALTRSVDVQAMYRDTDADFLSRFPKPFWEDSFENFYKYFSKQVPVKFDPETNVVVLQVQAFKPGDAQAINERLLRQSEALVNRLNDRAQKQAIQENQRQVEEATLRLSKARVALQRYRNAEKLLDPAEQASGVLQVSNNMVAEQAALRAQLQATESATPSHPSLPALRAKIAAISAQIAAQDSKAVGTQTGIASKLTEYERLAVEQEFATQMLNAANTALEQSRAEAQKQQFYLERVVEPNKPDMALLPNRFRNILTIAGIVICLYLIGWMLIVGILEHSPDD